MSDVIIIGCVQAKLDHPAPARDLYTSPLFRKRRGYAEASGKPWAIVSALHGIVEPDRIIAPYDFEIGERRKDELEGWGSRCATGYHSIAWIAAEGDYERQRDALQGCVVEIHAGMRYIDAIAHHLTRAGATVETPLAGLGIGAQLAWYGTRLGRLTNATATGMVAVHSSTDDPKEVTMSSAMLEAPAAEKAGEEQKDEHDDESPAVTPTSVVLRDPIGDKAKQDQAKPDPKTKTAGGSRGRGKSTPARRKATSATRKTTPARKTSTARKTAGEKKLSALAAAEVVLKRAGGPLHVNDITARILAMPNTGLKGKTPEASVGAILAVNAKKRDSAFKRTKPGTYTLKAKAAGK